MVNKLRNRLRNWLLLDYNPKTQTVRPAEITDGAIDLIMLHQEWLEALDARVKLESEYTAARFNALAEVVSLMEPRKVPMPDGFDERWPGGISQALAGFAPEPKAEAETAGE